LILGKKLIILIFFIDKNIFKYYRKTSPNYLAFVDYGKIIDAELKHQIVSSTVIKKNGWSFRKGHQHLTASLELP